MRVPWSSGLRVETLALFQGWGMGSEVMLEHVQLNFNCRNKFIILLPCGLLVHNNTFLNMCIFKSRTDYTDCGGCENRNAHFLIIMKSKAMKSVCWLFQTVICCIIKMMDCALPLFNGLL